VDLNLYTQLTVDEEKKHPHRGSKRHQEDETEHKRHENGHKERSERHSKGSQERKEHQRESSQQWNRQDKEELKKIKEELKKEWKAKTQELANEFQGTKIRPKGTPALPININIQPSIPAVIFDNP
jgi:hypothetical protein